MQTSSNNFCMVHTKLFRIRKWLLPNIRHVCNIRKLGHMTETEQVVGTVLGLLFMSPTADVKKLFYGETLWSWWTGASYLSWAGQTVCVQGKKLQLWSDLHPPVSLRCTVEMGVCSQSPSQQSALHAKVSVCPWWWRQHSTGGWRRWEWTQWM